MYRFHLATTTTTVWLLVGTVVLAACAVTKTNAFSMGASQVFDDRVVANSRYRHSTIILAAGATEETTWSIEDIRSMRVKEIKGELMELGVSTSDCFEKEELVQRLYDARQDPTRQKSSSPTSRQQESRQNGAAKTALEVPLYLTSLETGTRVAAVNGANIAVEAKDHPYPSIKIEVLPRSGNSFTLSLLLDTACSGIVLRPSVVQKFNLPSLSTPVTMTGAGGVSSNTGLTQLDNFRLETETFGPLPAAVQDIGALPSSLDGIIGLSFLNQFAGVDLDFRLGKIFLYPKGSPLAPVPPELTVVAEGPMALVRSLGIFAVDVFLGGRGPVKMLIDSGASDTFLNWKGVSDLSVSRDSKFLNRLPGPMGAVGSDAVAMQLTHRVNISSNLNLGNSGKPGLSLMDSRRLSIDIGDIAILETLRGDGVGGILGIDAFMRCDAVRMTFQGRDQSIKFLLNSEEANSVS